MGYVRIIAIVSVALVIAACSRGSSTGVALKAR